MRLVGKVLWWDSNDENGVIVDAGGNEYYFDGSVVENRSLRYLKPGKLLTFFKNPKIRQTLCAHRVSIPGLEERPALRRQFERQRTEALEL